MIVGTRKKEGVALLFIVFLFVFVCFCRVRTIDMYFERQRWRRFRDVGSCNHRGHLTNILMDNTPDVVHQCAIEDMSMAGYGLIPHIGLQSMVHIVATSLI